MTADYIITLKNEKLRTYEIMGWILVLTHAALSSVFAFLYKNPWYFIITAITVVSAAAILILNRKKMSTAPQRINRLTFLLFLLPMCWLWFAAFILAAVMIGLSTLHGLSVQPKKILFSKEGIRYPSFPVKRIQWNKLNNLILKDGLLTIDFKSDKLIQQPIEDPEGTVDEAAFNEFCRRQLFANK